MSKFNPLQCDDQALRLYYENRFFPMLLEIAGAEFPANVLKSLGVTDKGLGYYCQNAEKTLMVFEDPERKKGSAQETAEARENKRSQIRSSGV